MKSKHIFSIYFSMVLISSCATLTSGVSPVFPIATTYDIKCDTGPLEINKANQLSIKFINNSSTNVTIMIKVYYKRENGTYGLVKTIPYETYLRKSSNDIILNLEDWVIFQKETTLRFLATDNNSNQILEGEFIVKGVDLDENGKYKTIYPEKLSEEKYIGLDNYSSISILENRSDNYSDEFTFINFSPYVSNEYYHRINFSNFRIEYKNKLMENEFIYKNAYLDVKDDEEKDLYRYLSIYKTKDGYRRIPINLTIYMTISKSLIYFDTKGIFFVNPNTLEMSTIKLPGFLKTNYFYFPKMEYETSHISEFRLVIEDMTLNHYSLIYTFESETNLHLLGNNNDSKFFITTDLENEYSNYGEEIYL